MNDPTDTDNKYISQEFEGEKEYIVWIDIFIDYIELVIILVHPILFLTTLQCGHFSLYICDE